MCVWPIGIRPSIILYKPNLGNARIRPILEALYATNRINDIVARKIKATTYFNHICPLSVKDSHFKHILQSKMMTWDIKTSPVQTKVSTLCGLLSKWALSCLMLLLKVDLSYYMQVLTQLSWCVNVRFTMRSWSSRRLESVVIIRNPLQSVARAHERYKEHFEA